jgi:S-DNA-T family DNA segregation ATPase FtsK/SpoIIIE
LGCISALKRVIVVVDELAELLDAGGVGKEEKAIIQAINKNLRTLARISRAAGVHLILGVQRPDASIINGQIKSNISFRICGRFSDPQPSIIVLGNSKATELPAIAGRFIADNQEIQAYYFTSEQMTDLQPRRAEPKQTRPPKPKAEQPPPVTEEKKNRPAAVSVKTLVNSEKSLDLDFSEMDL